MRRTRVPVVLALLLTCFTAPPLSAQPATQPSAASDVEVREWLVLVCDPHNPRANAVELLRGTLPEAFNPLRPVLTVGDPLRTPSPVGVIRFVSKGGSEAPQKFTVRLTAPFDGVFYTAWPHAHVLSTEIVWRDLSLTPEPRRLASLDLDGWLAPLRGPRLPYLTRADRSERFLLYDVEFPYGFPLRLESGITPEDPVTVGNTGGPRIHDLCLYRPPRRVRGDGGGGGGGAGGGWSSGHCSQVTSNVGAADAPAPPDPTTVSFAPAGDDPAAILAADWKPRLAPFELPTPDLELILRILQTYVPDERQITAVYRMDDADVNRLLPLEITPRPARVRRLALIVARNIDPRLPQIIDELIAQLGDPDWNKREAASALLARCIPAANNALREATHGADAEIALRAERLLGR